MPSPGNHTMVQDNLTDNDMFQLYDLIENREARDENPNIAARK